jgi:hypothetical protein
LKKREREMGRGGEREMGRWGGFFLLPSSFFLLGWGNTSIFHPCIRAIRVVPSFFLLNCYNTISNSLSLAGLHLFARTI